MTTANNSRLSGKTVLLTGGAQGFGLGIAQVLYAEGASVALADVQTDKVQEAAGLLGERACGITADVTDEASVANMVRSCAERFGGIDLYVSNAGILKAGGLDDLTLADFERVTKVNYTGYFLTVKHVAAVMKAQHAADPAWRGDIVQVNSKSGLSGSNKNFAYAGSKFGGIGLTQSFALELAPFGIKVNAVCPGNYLDGPLWSDPERGLFVQYLQAGKVPGAKTLADVRAHYERQVPMGRGCMPEDVARAILYLVEQEYETGQALPVTGGQIMR